MTEPLRGNQLAPLIRSLRSRLNPDGTLNDDASPDLKRIRREIERQQRAIESSLRQALRDLPARAPHRKTSSPSAASAS